MPAGRGALTPYGAETVDAGSTNEIPNADEPGNGVNRRDLIVKGLAAAAAATLMSGAGKAQAAERLRPRRVFTTSPELERFLAKRPKATTIELDSGHLSLITHPRQITELILRAARHSG
jgi:hypothetical protein